MLLISVVGPSQREQHGHRDKVLRDKKYKGSSGYSPLSHKGSKTKDISHGIRDLRKDNMFSLIPRGQGEHNMKLWDKGG